MSSLGKQINFIKRNRLNYNTTNTFYILMTSKLIMFLDIRQVCYCYYSFASAPDFLRYFFKLNICNCPL